MSIYQRKLKRTDANNNFLSFDFLNREDRTDANNMSIYIQTQFSKIWFFKS